MEDKIVEFTITPMTEMYYNEDSLYGIYRFSTEEYITHGQTTPFDDNLFISTIVGNMQQLIIGAKYKCRATETYNKKYKQWQYKAVEITSKRPTTTEDNLNFLKCVLTERQAEALINVYPNIVEMIVNEECVDVSKVNGVGEKSFEKIKNKIIENYVLSDIITMLSPFGVSTKMIKKLMEGEKNNSAILKQKLMNNPYILTKIKGLGFKRIDKIALQINPKLRKSESRVGAYVYYALSQIGNDEGHSRVKMTKLDELVKKDIADCYDIYLKLIEGELKNPQLLHIDGDYVGLQKYYLKELRIFNKLRWLNQSPCNFKLTDEDIKRANEEFTKERGYELTDEQKRIIEYLQTDNVVLLTGNAGCVDCDTEFFNGNKWIPISEYKEGDKVLQYNKDGSANLVYPQRYIKQPKDYLWHFKTKYGIDQCLSDNHRFIYRTSKGHLAEKQFIEVRRMHEQSKNGFSGKVYTTFNYNGEGINLKDEEIELMCAVICDGHFPTKTSWCRINLKKQRKKERLKDILNRCNIDYKIKNRDDGYTVFKFYAPLRQKVFEPMWFNCSNKQLKIICDNILFWDGSVRNGRRSFSTTVKENADFVQFAFSSCGCRATIQSYNRIGKTHSENNKYTYKSIEYTVTITDKNMVGLIRESREKKTEINKYKTKDGFEYCFTVPSGMLVLRRNNKIFITGNCGKSSSIDFILKAYKYQRIALCALSAKASRRMAETTGKPASTIHKLLEFKGGNGFERNKENPLEYDIIIVDEASMVNSDIFLSLIDAIHYGTKIVIVFDSGQLPPIGVGNIATDLMECGYFKHLALTKVHRQAQDSGILTDANIIREGRNPLPSPKANVKRGKLEDMFYAFRNDKTDIFEMAIVYFMKAIKKLPIEEVVVCVPRKANAINCTATFNDRIQELLLGTESQYVEKGNKRFKLGAKVIQRTNEYDKNVVNGEVGFITSISKDRNDFQVTFDRGLETEKIIDYTVKELDMLELAYAITTHLSQGSQYHTVIVVIDNSSYILLSKELIYTAITRASKRCLVVAEPKAFNSGVHKKASKRSTWMSSIVESEKDKKEYDY